MEQKWKVRYNKECTELKWITDGTKTQIEKSYSNRTKEKTEKEESSKRKVEIKIMIAKNITKDWKKVKEKRKQCDLKKIAKCL